VAQSRIWEIRFDPERDLVVSQFRLYDPWIGANGRERDRMVFALSNVVVAVEIRAGGVMQNECVQALRKGREVCVYMPSDSTVDGNNALLHAGCTPVTPESANSFLATLDVARESEPVPAEEDQ
jgi:predicted Rossmann fold nucleotide-binding protein DprA/Smf involved in DNA uptake